MGKIVGMLFLITDIVIGTWKFSTFSCVAYLVFEAMNKFVAPVIVVLISRTCYVTICLDPESRRVAASMKVNTLTSLSHLSNLIAQNKIGRKFDKFHRKDSTFL